ncbi:SulP family inorganic anion transporter [Egicoccus halophilus]|uniref:SulP family inorganic anion transporter n=1 Tax=Egicoccus halophilus TaxID=1670830 RepID=UPI00197AFBC9|nr:SulP family inorganic anion transporter [Egicoccus halophilus]
MPQIRSRTTADPRPRSARLREQWWQDPRTELLAGLVVALALIPEAIAFSLIAGVDPKVGLYASFSIAIILAFAGGRPAMISAATGAMALLMVPLVREHGVEYLFAATVVTGVLQLVLGWLGIGNLMRFVPRTVMTGFVNALAVLIFLAQLPYVVEEGWAVWAMVAGGLAIMYALPRITRVVPAPLVAIVALTAVAVAFDVRVPTVGGMGELPDTLPVLGIPAVPLTLETLQIVAPYALALAFVGLLESLLTAQLLDDVTGTPSDKGRESRAQGLANVATGFLGGMAGCAMIGQSMINVRSGARTRLSTLSAGVFLLVLILLLGDLVALIPMAALVAVMVVVAVATFEWSSLKLNTLRRTPKTETLVMLVTVGVVVVTHNLAYGVIAGVLLAMVVFTRRAAHHARMFRVLDPTGRVRSYVVMGELFFASANQLVHEFDVTEAVDEVVIDLHQAEVWDSSAVVVLDGIVARFAARGVPATIVGLSDHSAELHERLTGQLTAAH